MYLDRRSGILLHPTSLPGPHGSGDLGASAYYFVDWLAAGKQHLWQMLPLNDVGPAWSPYMSPAAWGGNVLLISLTTLYEEGLLYEADLEVDVPFSASRINYHAVSDFRMIRLRRAASRFFAEPHPEMQAYEDFCEQEKEWLNDYALFQTLDDMYGGQYKSWQNWPSPIKKREPKAIQEILDTHRVDIVFWKFCQWCFAKQWKKLKAYANARNILIIGDVPIFVSANSANVWAHPKLFKLDAEGYPLVVAGVPPDPFSETGQYWGNPLYDWKTHAAIGFEWWVRRMERMQKLYDVVRIDHFRGFEASWEIPASMKTAEQGRWEKGPGEALFQVLRKRLVSLRMIAEDLGTITPEVHALRENAGLPGMRILQFAFDLNPDNPYLPHQYERHTVVYTGTHDNDTTRGWWHHLNDSQKDFVRRYLSISGDWIHWDMIRAAWSSVADYALTPMQDVLGLDSAHRMNQPGEVENAWSWRFSWEQVDDWHASYLAEMTHLYGRIPPKLPEKRDKVTAER